MKYLIKTGKLYLSIIKAENETEAWVISVTNNDSKKFWDLEDARQEIIRMGCTTIAKTKMEGVFKLN